MERFQFHIVQALCISNSASLGFGRFHVGFLQSVSQPHDLGHTHTHGCAQVWQRDFGGRLRVRSSSQHSKCSICVKHKLVIRKLGHNTLAKKAQMQLLAAHLNRQYRDRTYYWSSRSLSRLSANTAHEQPTLCLILDSMDMAKHAFPRSRAMFAKDFSSWPRPRLAHTCCIAHGHAVLTALSLPGLPLNSSRSCEILANTLTEISSRADLRVFHLNLQADNCAREIKNVTTMRMLAFLTACHKIRSASATFLVSGHSHEDVDAHFGTVSEWLATLSELHTSSDFRDGLHDFMKKPTTRQHEPFKRTIMLHSVRNWLLDSMNSIVCSSAWHSSCKRLPETGVTTTRTT